MPGFVKSSLVDFIFPLFLSSELTEHRPTRSWIGPDSIVTSSAFIFPLFLSSELTEHRPIGSWIGPDSLKVTKAVVDPLSMHSNDDAVDKDVVMSIALPFTTCPAHLTGELAGDFGFDPLGFTKSRSDLMTCREAEIKHARLAMLAAAGWPLSEVFDRKIAALLHLSPLLDKGERVPSLLNGGLEKVNPFYWMGCVAIAAAVEFYGVNKSRAGDESYFPGNLGFDPLGLYPKDEDGQRRMQLAEIKNGRVAMIAVLGFAIQEFVLKVGVVDETPYFFFPWGNAIN